MRWLRWVSVGDGAQYNCCSNDRKPSKWITLFHMSNNRHDTLLPSVDTTTASAHEPRAQRSPALRPRRRRGQLHPRRRAPGAAQVDRVAPRRRAGSAAGRAAAAAHDAQAHRHRFRPRVLEHARHVVEDVEAAAVARAEPADRAQRPACACRCRATSPTSCSRRCWRSSSCEYPAITLEVDLSARFVDLIGENFDVAIRMGELRDDASLAARRLAVFTVSLYAAPAYLARRGTPPEPEALMEHDALRVLARTGDPMPWVLTRGEQRWEGIPPGRATANSPELLMRLALARRGHHGRQRSLRRCRTCEAASSSRCCRTGACRRSARGRCSRAAG